MDLLNAVILLALLATVAALGIGLGSMAHGGVFDERHSTQLMFVRVGAQAVTFVLLLIAIYLASAG
ncbi:MAG: twin transmembrane helix small protein [Gammaproteobacteria bacterium]